MSPHFLAGWVSRLSFLSFPGSGILGFRQCWCPFPSSSISRVFLHSLFFTCHRISFVFLLYDWCICTHRTTPHLGPAHFFGEFPGLGLALVSDAVVPEAEQSLQRCARSRHLVSNFCPGRGLNLGPCSLMAANVATRLGRTPTLYIYRMILRRWLLSFF